jgi:hypothetical protein
VVRDRDHDRDAGAFTRGTEHFPNASQASDCEVAAAMLFTDCSSFERSLR